MTPIEIENAKRGGRYFLGGILKRQKGTSIISTIPILSDDIRIGGTESFNANFVIGKALPYAKAMKNKINKCFKGN